ncbi:hypothetical protein BH23CHL5_BH23CHL5_18960 [soil metagenome]
MSDNEILHSYLRLAFHTNRHFPGFIDAYFGEPATKERALDEPLMEPAELVVECTALLEFLGSLDLPEYRKNYLQKQAVAMHTIARKLGGEDIRYEDEVALCFDIVPERLPEVMFETAIAELDILLPGSGSVRERMAAYRANYVIDRDQARRAIDLMLHECRQRTLAFVDLPPDETVEISFVQDQPWSGYNWYLGNARSRVDINTDLPIQANDLLNLVAHEAYPGHHTEHCIKGERLFRGRGYRELSIQLINTPECVIHEGIATLAESMIFPDSEAAEWKQAVLYPSIGLNGDAARDGAIQERTTSLRAVAGNAALRRHADGESAETVVDYLATYTLRSTDEARHRFSFIDDPLWRPYVFTYHVGGDLIGRWLDASTSGERQTRFTRLLSEQVTPSQIRGELPI